MGDSHMGLRARLMSQALRKLTGVLSKASTSAIFINQVRQKIGISFGNPYTTPGGLALKFHASVRMDIRRISTLQQGSESIGIRVKVKIVKNKLAPPFKEAEFDIMYGEGISKEGELLDFGQSLNLVEKSGAWYTYGETSLGQGRENVKLFLKENPKIAEKLEKKIREEINISDGQDNEDRTAEKEEKQS
jgi:recombination protein RecA